ncbi:MAG: LysE family transporter [Alteromonadaceae bacterium]|nr:LysE family transporter [Alteromonadaceae bacterium]
MTSTIQLDTTSFMQIFEQLQGMILPLCLFSFLATATPGPNNILLTVSGNQFGFRRSLPFLIGIRLGIGVIFFMMGTGVGSLILSYPKYYLTLKYLGAAYLIYLASAHP